MPESTEAASNSDNGKGKLVMLFAPLPPLLALAGVWLCGWLSRFDTPDEIAAALSALRDSPNSLLYALLGFGAGTLFFVPITVLIAGTMLAFGAVRGFWVAFLGVQLAGTTTYFIGRAIGAPALDQLHGPRIAKLRARLAQHAVLASAATRALPIGNFTLINWLMGGLKVPFRSFIVGNALGTIPGLIVLAVFADRLSSALRDPQPQQIGLLIGAGASALLLMHVAQRIARRFAR
jgi:phospholipase D1/2